MVKLFAAEDSEAGAMRKIMENAIENQQRERRIHLTTDTSVVLINTVLTLAISTISFWGLVDGFVTIGQFVASIAIVLRLNANSRAFLQMGQQVFQAVGTIRDAMPVVTTPPTIIDVPNARSLTVRAGEVEFRNVQFEYRQGQGVIEGLRSPCVPARRWGWSASPAPASRPCQPAPSLLRSERRRHLHRRAGYMQRDAGEPA